MNAEEFRNAKEASLQMEAARCLERYQDAANTPGYDHPGFLLEAQFYMQELDRRHDAKIVRRDFALELIIIALILAEIIIAFIEGGKQTDVLRKLESSAAATATTLNILQNTTELMNTAAQRQAGTLLDDSAYIYFYDGNIVIVNTGKLDFKILKYAFDGRLPERFSSGGYPVSHGDSFTVDSFHILEQINHFNAIDPMPFHVVFLSTDGKRYRQKSYCTFPGREIHSNAGMDQRPQLPIIFPTGNDASYHFLESDLRNPFLFSPDHSNLQQPRSAL